MELAGSAVAWREGLYAAGKRALDQREVVTEGMEGLLALGYPETLPDLVPTADSGQGTSQRAARNFPVAGGMYPHATE